MTSEHDSQPLPPQTFDDPSRASANLVAGDSASTAVAAAAAELYNRHNVAANAHVDVGSPSPSQTPAPFPAAQIQFRTNTIAPSPPLAQSPSRSPVPPRAEPAGGDDHRGYHPSPLGDYPAVDGLRLETAALSAAAAAAARPSALVLQHKASASSLQPVSRTPSFKTGLAHGFGTASAASSTFPSPVISAMGDMTPLPSPLLSSDSPGPWKRIGRRLSHEVQHLLPPTADSVLVTSNGESVASALASQIKRRAYAGLTPGGGQVDGPPDNQSGHGRNRSISDYVPDPMQIPKRMVTVSGTHTKSSGGPDGVENPYEPHMRREPNLSEARGLTPIEKPPTPPPSESSLVSGDSTTPEPRPAAGKKAAPEFFEAHGRDDKKLRRWRAIKMLGQGTFSRVMLATSQMPVSDDEDEPLSSTSGLLTPEPQARYDRRTLVAVKVCEHGPKGGASEDRIEMSLKRELEIMQTIHHPSLVHLKAWNIEATRAILVLSYCPGGDLFDVASTYREVLSPSLLRRMFAELVGAVRYLHERHIVHRDIKLENVLVNIPPAELADTTIDWTTYPHSVATLTDLGLSRRVADDERLETRCGSDDYAAPEVIMGQPYSGYATDAWSLGVLLYAILEGRLPFDPYPGATDAHRMRSRTSHRIARVEWRWFDFAGDDGDHDADLAKFDEKGLRGAMEITEGLLKRARSRWTMDQVAAHEWVSGAVAVEGGVKFRDEEEGEEVL